MKEPLPGRKTPNNCLEGLAVELMRLKPQVTAYCFEERLDGDGTYLWFNIGTHTHIIKIDSDFSVEKWEEKIESVNKLFKNSDSHRKFMDSLVNCQAEA